MWFVQRLITSVDCEAAVWCGRYGEQQTLDALLHSGWTEACLVTALADQPAECYHNQVVTVPVQPSGIAVLSQRQISVCKPAIVHIDTVIHCPEYLLSAWLPTRSVCGMTQWLERRSLAGGLSVIYTCMVDMWPFCGSSVRYRSTARPTQPSIPLESVNE